MFQIRPHLAVLTALSVIGFARSARGETYLWETFAGNSGGRGATDGPLAVAHYAFSTGLAPDSEGNVYVADTGTSIIRKITPGGIVATLAGTADVTGSTDGPGSAALFNGCNGVAVGSDGMIYVADRDNHTIRRITPAGVVSTLAGSAGQSGSSNGTGSAARFNSPTDVTVDRLGNVFVADRDNHSIRKVTPAGVVTTLAGSASAFGSINGNGSVARFRNPEGLVVDAVGTVYVADTLNPLIRRVSATGEVSTLAGTAGAYGSSDGTGAAARFIRPRGIKLDSAGNLLVADSNTQTIRKVTPAGVVTTLAGSPDQQGFADGQGAAARFDGPAGLTLDRDGNILVGDTGNWAIRKITPAGGVSTLSGGPKQSGSNDGTGTAARFVQTGRGALDAAGNFYVPDPINCTIRKITPQGVVTTVAGSPGAQGSANGTGSAARFYRPASVGVDASGNLFVADTMNHTIRKITPGGVVTTFAGLAGDGRTINGTGTGARFNWPAEIVVAPNGTMYVIDASPTVRKITPAGVVTTFAGNLGENGSADGTGTAARFYNPIGMAVDAAGNVFVADVLNRTIRRITPAGVVTTVAGTAGIQGFVDGPASQARFALPMDVAVDAAGNLYVADEGNHSVRKITPGAGVTTIGGIPGIDKIGDGPGSIARFTRPGGISCTPGGTLYLSDTDNYRIARGTVIPPEATGQAVTTAEDTLLPVTLSGTDIDGDPLTFVIVAPPTHGTLNGAGAAITYTPAPDYYGPDSFSFKVNDGALDSAPAVVAITVTAVNDAPVATAQAPGGVEDTPLPVTLAGTDTENDALTFAIVTPPAHGSLTGTPPNLTYSPAANYFGGDSFSFKVSDGSLDSAPAEVLITVRGVNDAPEAAPQTVAAVEDTPLTFALTGTDVESDPLTFIIVTAPAHGTVSGAGPAFTYTPARDYNGADFFTYKVNDGALDSTTETVLLNIAAVNDPPTFTAPLPAIDAGPAAPDGRYDIKALLRDPDEGDSHTWRIVSNSDPSIFSEVTIGGGQLSLKYAPWVSGVSSLTIEAKDAAGEIAQMTVQVMLPVLPVPEISASEPLKLNRQTGLWEQRIAVKNIAQRAIGGFEVIVSGLPAGACLYNASDCLSGDPRAGYYQPMAPGESVTMVLEYYVPDRAATLRPVLTTAVALPKNPPAGAAAGLAVDRVVVLPDHALLIEFTALPSHEYIVQYSTDGIVWLDSPVRIRAAGNRVQWIDRGSPRTTSAPVPGTTRFYRVRESAAAP